MEWYRLFCKKQGEGGTQKHKFRADSPEELTKEINYYLEEHPGTTPMRLVKIRKGSDNISVPLPPGLNPA